jgi:hypothetical protein
MLGIRHLRLDVFEGESRGDFVGVFSGRRDGGATRSELVAQPCP